MHAGLRIEAFWNRLWEFFGRVFLYSDLQRVNNHIPSRTKWPPNSKYQLPSRDNVHPWSSQERHNTGYHMPSLVFTPPGRGLKGQSRRALCYCYGRAGGSRAWDLGAPHLVYEYTLYRIEFKSTFCKLRFPAGVYFSQYVRTIHLHCNIP